MAEDRKVYDENHPPEIHPSANITGTTYFGKDVKVGNATIKGEWKFEDGVIIEDGCVLEGKGTVGKDAVIRYSHLTGDIYVGSGARIIKSTFYERVKVEEGSNVVGSSLGVYGFESEGIEIGKDNQVINSFFYGTASVKDGNKIMGATLDGKVTLENKNTVEGKLKGTVTLGDSNTVEGKLEGTLTIGNHNALEGKIKGILTMGDYNDIKNSATLGSEPQIRSNDNKTLESYLEIGSYNKIWGDVQGSPDKDKKTKVGNHVTIMTLTHVAHGCEVDDHAVITTSSNLAGHVKVGRWAVVSGDNKIEQHVVIGPYSFTEGGIKLRKDVLPFFRGNPEENTAVNVIGLRRAFLYEAGISEEEIEKAEKLNEPSLEYQEAVESVNPIIEEIEDAYHLIFKRRENNYESREDLIAQLREKFRQNELVLELADFIEKAYHREPSRLYIHTKDIRQNGNQKLEALEKRIEALEKKRKRKWYSLWPFW